MSLPPNLFYDLSVPRTKKKVKNHWPRSCLLIQYDKKMLRTSYDNFNIKTKYMDPLTCSLACSLNSDFVIIVKNYVGVIWD
jgi:hypothetical protein